MRLAFSFLTLFFYFNSVCFSGTPEGMIAIPAGEFIMGTDAVDEKNLAAEHGIVKPWFVDEGPSHKIFLPLFYMDQFEVTNTQYAKFLLEKRRSPPPYWERGVYPKGSESYPVVMVSWSEAEAFCRFKGGRLPSEAEWEKAARGVDGRWYPWKGDFDLQKANVGGFSGDLRPVGSYENGKSPFGIYDMIGNVWEWTADWYQPYPGSPYKSDKYGKPLKVIRGNSWSSLGHFPPDIQAELLKHHSTTTFRLFAPPDSTITDVGFRCMQPA